MMNMKDTLWALLVVLVWGVNFVIIRWGLTEIPPFLLATLRFGLAFFPAILWVRKPQLAWRWLVLYGLLNSFAQFGFLFWAMNVGMPAGLASVVHQSQVFFTLILSVWILQQRTRAAQWLGLLCAAMGLALMAYGRGTGQGHMTGLGLALNLSGALAWASGNIVVAKIRSAGHTPDALGLVVWSSWVPIIPFAALSWILESEQYPDSAQLSWHSVVSVLYLAWVATLLGYALWSRLLGRYEPNRVAPFSLLVPVVGLVSASWAFGEQLNLWQWVGSVFILLGLVVHLWGHRMWQTVAGKL